MPLLILALLAAGCTSVKQQDSITYSANADEGQNEVVATVNGVEFTMKEVLTVVAAEERALTVGYLTERHSLLKSATEYSISQHLLEKEAEKAGVATIEELLAVEIESKTQQPNPVELGAAVAQAMAANPGVPEERIRASIESQMTRQAQMEAYGRYIETLRAAAKVEVNLPYPNLPRVEIPVLETDPSRGNTNAPVTVVEFTEYQCPYCAKGAPTMDALIAKYGDNIRIVTKDYPLPFHENAMGAAVASHCANAQSKHHEYTEFLFRNQTQLGPDKLMQYANDAGLDVDAFTACLSSPAPTALVQANMELAGTIGVEATPTYFINGIMISGAVPVEQFTEIIDSEL